MALKDRLRSKRSKRFSNVPDHFWTKEEKVNFSSSDSNMEETLDGKKVGEGFSIKQLMKEGENYRVDGDHIYTYGKSQSNVVVDLNKSRNIKQRMKRKISEESEEKPEKQRCVSKNAIMARLNRERRKKYISSLEGENEDLRKQNDEINSKILAQNKTISVMKHEILYLKGLLANSKEICQILKNFKASTGLPVTSSTLSETDIKSGHLTNCLTNKNLDVANEDLYQPRLRSVNSGYNFPILDKDINLGSSSNRSSFTDFESDFFDFENTLYDSFEPTLVGDMKNDDVFNFSSHTTDSELEKSLKLDDLQSYGSEAGICLHVNTRGLSVEFCSICNRKARLSALQSDCSP